MSEYQYYEFQAIDRPLTEKEQDEISRLSSRVDLSSRRAVFTYSYGDFRGDPLNVLQKYFDAMLYLANWGSKQLVFRLPRSVIAPEMIKPYCIEDMVSVTANSSHVILEISCQDEEGDGWIEGEGQLDSLVSLRQDILRGDFSVLYLAWLKAISISSEMDWIEDGDEEAETASIDDRLEPPLPANLQNLSLPLKRFVDFFEIDNDLIKAASSASPQSDAAGESRLEELIVELPERERQDFLRQIVRGEPNVSLQLIKRLREIEAKKRSGNVVPAPPRRRAADLLAAAQEEAKIRKEKARRKAEKARVQRLNEMSKEQPKLWEEIFALIEKKQSNAYDEAVERLIQMRELSEHLRESERFKRKIAEIYDRYRSRHGLISRLQRADLRE